MPIFWVIFPSLSVPQPFCWWFNTDVDVIHESILGPLLTICRQPSAQHVSSIWMILRYGVLSRQKPIEGLFNTTWISYAVVGDLVASDQSCQTHPHVRWKIAKSRLWLELNHTRRTKLGNRLWEAPGCLGFIYLENWIVHWQGMCICLGHTWSKPLIIC